MAKVLASLLVGAAMRLILGLVENRSDKQHRFRFFEANE